MGKIKTILLADMNSFFASCHQSVEPSLRGKPVIVGGSLANQRRGLVVAASYEAKKYGVYTTMSSYEAKKRCPQGIFVLRDHGLYASYSAKIMDFLRLIGDTEVASIDEAYVDITKRVEDGMSVKQITAFIQQTLWDKLHMPCSIGVGPNRIVAKMAADVKKPRGVVQMGVKQYCSYFHPQPVYRLHGCGQKTAEKLQRNDIVTIGDLAKVDAYKLKLLLGMRGELLQRAALGQSSDVVDPERVKGNKSIGKETTFVEMTSSPEIILSTSEAMIERLAEKLQEKRKKARTLSIVYKLERGERSHTKSITLPDGTNKKEEILKQIEILYNDYIFEIPLYLYGVRLSNLEDVNVEQLSFDDLWTDFS
ncbi:Y-family DNA polymerase [Bacillus horti]|uniref:DNA polymerase IV n=1 Tax=Caldalkalibacillus horti TaxID=77523 RepID=A0ABT9W2M1_9BACI|nr:DNA polymerase IV [Bacillus horti]MDQ0167489.1 DNA polymerase-4 [Bacillus horti]